MTLWWTCSRSTGMDNQKRRKIYQRRPSQSSSWSWTTWPCRSAKQVLIILNHIIVWPSIKVCNLNNLTTGLSVHIKLTHTYKCICLSFCLIIQITTVKKLPYKSWFHHHEFQCVVKQWPPTLIQGWSSFLLKINVDTPLITHRHLMRKTGF